jgi:coenzyme Q-binding protein COQ10
MNSQNIKFSIIVLVAVSLVLGIIYVRISSLEYEKNSSFDYIVNINKNEFFKLMSNPEIYPTVLPENYKSIKIVENQTNVIISEEVVQERGITTKLLVKHILTPNQIHQIEILDGDAKGSIVTTKFIDIGDNTTKISVIMEIKLKGILGVFSDMTHANYNSAFNNIILNFERYYLLHN